MSCSALFSLSSLLNGDIGLLLRGSLLEGAETFERVRVEGPDSTDCSQKGYEAR